jgi:hypothetical protein
MQNEINQSVDQKKLDAGQGRTLAGSSGSSFCGLGAVIGVPALKCSGGGGGTGGGPNDPPDMEDWW